MLTEQLRTRVLELDGQIDSLEKEMAPMQERLDRLQELRKQAVRLLELENGTGPAKITRIERAVRRNRNGEPVWSIIAAERGFRVGKDSAHRVVAREDPALHASIAHENCKVDNRSYP